MFFSLLSYSGEVDRDGPLFAAHKDFIVQHVEAGTFVCSGPRVGVAGGAILVRGDDEAEVRALLDADPFVADGFATYELHQFNVGLGSV